MANLISSSASEFEPARLAEIPPDPAPMPKSTALGKSDEASSKLDEPKPGEPPKLKTETLAAMATAFETRNIGTTLEIEGTLDPKTMRIRAVYSAQHSVVAGMAKHSIVADGKTTIVEQPKFLASRVQSEFTFASGRRALISTFRSPTKEGWMELFFLRATARPVK